MSGAMPSSWTTKLRPSLALTTAAAVLFLLGLFAAPSQAASLDSVSAFDSLATIRPDRPLPVGGQSGARISAAGNEFESFQIVIQAGSSGLSGVSVQGDGLQGPGNATIPASNLTIYREANYQVTQRSDAEGDVGSWPDALIPERDNFYGEDRNAFPVDVAANGKLAVWVDVLVPQDQRGGVYRTHMLVSDSSGAIARVPLRLRVYPFSIPSTSSLNSLFHIDGISLPGGDQTLFAAAALDNRVTISNLWPFPDSRFQSQILPLLQGTDPRVRLPGAKLTALDAYQCAAGCLSPWHDLAERYPVVGRRFVDYICDEPTSPEAWDTCNSTATAANLIWPGVRKLLTTDAAHMPGWATDLAPIVNDIHRDGQKRYLRLRGRRVVHQGRQGRHVIRTGPQRRIWPYTSCRSFGCDGVPDTSNEDNGWPGYAIDQPASQARAMGWLSFEQGASGELYWDTTTSLSSAFSDQFESGGNGDGNLFYPGTPNLIGGTHAIPLESIRLKRIRDGREDYEYLHLLGRRDRRPAAMGVASSLLGPRTTAMQHATLRPQSLEAARHRLAAMILGS